MSPTTRTKRGKKNAETQTGHLDTMLEIARLQEQVTLLTIENDHLRKHITESSAFKPATPRSPDVAITPSSGVSKRRTAQLRNGATKNSKVTGRGCNCKGNCSNRICGCMKKNMHCGESCRCNNTLCQNQEERDTEGNKENEESNERPLVEPGQITNKRLANVTAHKSIFSPDGAQHSTPKLQSTKPSSIYFGSPKKLTFSLDEEQKEEDKIVNRKAVKNFNADGVKQLDQPKRVIKRPRLRRNHLEVNTDYTRKLRSSSNEEKGKSGMGVDKQTLRRCISSEISVPSPEALEEIKNRTDNHLWNIADGMAPLRRRQKNENSSVKERRKNIADRGTEETSAAPVKGNATEASQDAAVQASTSLDQEQMGSPLRNTLHESGSSDVIQGSDFNPMKPQHELTRTPAHNSSDSSSGNSSDILPLTPVFTIKVEELPIPPELSQPEVNWDEHQSQLVACKKCKRKFHSFRIAKHQACCKKL